MISGFGRGDELIHLRLAQDLRQRLLGLGPLELLEDGVRIVALGGEESQEDANRRQPAGDGLGGLAAAGLVLEILRGNRRRSRTAVGLPTRVK